jgi:hypothetical protein
MVDPEETSPEAPPGLMSEEGRRRVLEQAFELWINPELERRKEAGTLPDSFQLHMAQRIQHPDGKVVVRFNEEARGVALARATRAVAKGDPITFLDIDQLEAFDVPDDELDCGHWTVIRGPSGWFSSFNFLINRAKCRNLLEKAYHFP